MTAGTLNDRLRFEAPVPDPDEYGGEFDGWAPQFTVAAGLTYLRGGEAVMQARMAGRNVIAVKIRRSRDSLRISTDWRAVNSRTGEILNVRAILPSADRAFLDLTCETGVQN